MLGGSHGPQENFSRANKSWFTVSFNFIYGKLKPLVCSFMVTILNKEIYLGGDVTTKSSKIDPQQTVMNPQYPKFSNLKWKVYL